jgi:hypothetical protein
MPQDPNRYKDVLQPDDPQFMQAGAELMNTLSPVFTNWLAEMAIKDIAPKEAYKASVMVFAAMVGTLAETCAKPDMHALFADDFCDELKIFLQGIHGGAGVDRHN